MTTRNQLPTKVGSFREGVHTYIFDQIKALNPSADIVWEDMQIKLDSQQMYNASTSSMYTDAEIKAQNVKSVVKLSPRRWYERGDNNPSKRYRHQEIEFTYTPITDVDILTHMGFSPDVEYEYELGLDGKVGECINRNWGLDGSGLYLDIQREYVSNDEYRLRVSFVCNEEWGGLGADTASTFTIENNQYNTNFLKLVSKTQGMTLTFKRDSIDIPDEEDLPNIGGGNLNVRREDMYVTNPEE